MADRNQLLNDPEEAMRLVLDGRQSTIWTAIPGIVQKVDFTKMTCEVQPAIRGSIEDESGKVQSVDLPLLINVPIVFPSAGGFTITMPLKANDEVLVVFSARAIDAWWQSSGVQQPVEARMHDLSDGFAIPGPRSVPNAVSGISTNSVQIRKDDGSAYVEVAQSGKVKLISGDKITIANDTNDLKGVINGLADLLDTLNTALTAFSATVQTDPIALVTASAAVTLSPALTALTAQIAAYKLSQTGALLE